MLVRRAATLGYLDAGWITSKRTFSNNSYWDPRYKNWKSLRVINDDCQQPGNMVPKHRHDAFDILGYMVSGELEHWDSCGNLSRAQAGQIQHMHCGSGIWHTEASVGIAPARYIQIWVINPVFTEAVKEAPYYELLDKGPEFSKIPIEFKSGMEIWAGVIDGHETITVESAYVYVVSGSFDIGGMGLSECDGAELSGDLTAEFTDCHMLLFKQS